MPSRRTAGQALNSTGQGRSESHAAPKHTIRPPIAGDDDASSDTQGAHIYTPLVTSPIAKTPKRKHWRIVHRRCLQVFKDADKEREELTQSIQQLEEDNAQATTKVRHLSDKDDRNLAKIQELEFQVSSLKQQLQFAQACCTTGDNVLPILLEVSSYFQYAQNQLEKKIEAEKNAEKNKSAFAGLPTSDVLQGSWPVNNGQMGSFGTNSLPNYPLPNTLSSTNQQAPIQYSQQPLQQVPVQFSQQPLQQASQYIAQL
ncbi:uncharacterized protein N7446_005257 [Penicillium canescens]|uniref:Uncharacterized protein n=1 Tax=Penicillium canescens TaxID=5083 RepID=A0AAD6IAG6_PENCN|nr:uncharacterized protein N7446_005223 [Penicillium canescens]XP_058375334.1 uncharacterized protein N7446_005257 [Penicillium canescens]KAJ6038424.1 hypothetical protein N7460_008195 [Penicillium canescens]KAJ6038454.1 hypothetical protein N7460_008225 [Penicillium canescens]KAJ6068186.1 hypothetical protein N7446_005223 [Penicillium canescens]KAJ6068220.1 hypothetical protein N7446_005257 [Penicillium canescens]